MRDERTVPIIALDGLNNTEARELAMMLAPHVFAFKVHDLLIRYGWPFVNSLGRIQSGLAYDEPGSVLPHHGLMIDLKIYDTPKSAGRIAKVVSDVTRHNPNPLLLTVHAAGRSPMIKEVVKNFPGMVCAVTDLTSNDFDEESGWIYQQDRQSLVRSLAFVAIRGKAQALVCSGQEVGWLSQEPLLRNLKFIVPGTRLAGDPSDGHAQVVTPAVALISGATHLVWGERIVHAADPMAEFERHMVSVREGLAELESRSVGGPK